jgi:hypothetical protein
MIVNKNNRFRNVGIGETFIWNGNKYCKINMEEAICDLSNLRWEFEGHHRVEV